MPELHHAARGAGDRLVVAIVYGTRPEAVKVAPLWRALRQHPSLTPRLISTGQHRDMLAELHEWFEMTPDGDAGLRAAEAIARLLDVATDRADDQCAS